jgi:hypothetical protein
MRSYLICHRSFACLKQSKKSVMTPAITLRIFSMSAFLLIKGQSGAYAQASLFESDEVLPITLKGSLKGLLNDRSSDPKNFPLVLLVANPDSTNLDIPVEVKTRGHFRRTQGNCMYPPLLIHFPEDGPHLSSVFKEQKKLKLVMPCVGDDYVVREWLVYKLYNLLTPQSFRARLVQVTLADDKKKKPGAPFYGLLLEEEKQMARRNKLMAVEQKLTPQQLPPSSFLTMAVFQYLIGNTDWSIQYMQNIKFLATDSLAVPTPVPYDFDHAGIVSAPYAKPAEELLMSSIRERRYRGYCMADLKAFEPVLDRFNNLKTDIYNLYANCPQLDEKYKKTTARFLDEFYTTINNPEAWQKDFAYPCDKNGTGNVVIKGLKED